MYKDPKHEEDRKNAPKCGKEYFEGFCAELAQKVADIVGYDYELCLVKDGKYGQKKEDGTWNGVIGELTREVSDITNCVIQMCNVWCVYVTRLCCKSRR